MIATFKFFRDPRSLTQQLITGEPRMNKFSHSSSVTHSPHSVVRGRQRCSRYSGPGETQRKRKLSLGHFTQDSCDHQEGCQGLGHGEADFISPCYIPPNWCLVGNMILAMITVCSRGRLDDTDEPSSLSVFCPSAPQFRVYGISLLEQGITMLSSSLCIPLLPGRCYSPSHLGTSFFLCQ